MDFLNIKANKRTTKGNGPARALRRDGQIPAILYGPGNEPTSIAVDTHELELLLKSSRSGQIFVNMAIDGAGERKALLKELQRHPVSGQYIHADFYEVAMDRKIRVRVPVTTRGKSQGVEMGGMLQIIRRELEVLCLPDDIPEVIEIDITELDMGESVHVEDIPLEGDVEIPHEVNFTILTILSGRKVEEEEVDEEGEEAEVEATAEAEAETE
ncbi:MAG: 50S ribosomal protein L25/general stress protein Ctc [Desulfobacterales bacterium]|nr:50S ribosomal protein L25/general stress protein Ctc [Desulfobacterales bacterium]MDJ0883087.1 50S ribosomal protein L25/general stress protein Ctc [Desulfobacterales bacterium]